MKVDVAIQSYKKPESLAYTLLSLHRHCKNHIDCVYINDDGSGDGTLGLLKDPKLVSALTPWKLVVRENKQRMGWWYSKVKGSKPKYERVFSYVIPFIKNVYRTGHGYALREDIRYQFALDSTDKEYLYIIHDDVEFRGDILSIYLSEISKLASPAVVGELGQCWRCPLSKAGCNPAKIMSGSYLHSWPYTQFKNQKSTPDSNHLACRINEWSALVSVSASKKIEEMEGIFFGNFDNGGDVGAFWFNRAVTLGFSFSDPLIARSIERAEYYVHGWQGFSGHSVWSKQKETKSEYSPESINKILHDEFGFNWSHK